MKSSFIALFLLLFGLHVNGQPPSTANPSSHFVIQAVVIDGDTIPMITLREYRVSERRKRRSRKWLRLKRRIVKVYPYAKIAGELIREYEADLAKIKNKARQKLYMKKAEKDLKAEFKGEIINLSISQGAILIKLIDRETGQTSYELVKELKGNFSAFCYQAITRMFGNDLKSGYDPKGKDKMIEEIVQMIERGEIIVPERTPKTERAKQVRRKNKVKEWLKRKEERLKKKEEKRKNKANRNK